MSYSKSTIECDWCGKKVDDGDSVSCRPCFEENESLVTDLQEKITGLEKRIEELEQAKP